MKDLHLPYKYKYEIATNCQKMMKSHAAPEKLSIITERAHEIFQLLMESPVHSARYDLKVKLSRIFKQ